MFNFKKEYLKHIDGWLILSMLSLVSISLLAISSATSYSGTHDDFNHQLMFFITGIVLMTAVIVIDYHFLGDWYLAIYAVINLILIAVFLFGTNVNGAARWIRIGGMSIQPSEFAKIGVILCTAKLLEKFNTKMNQLKSILIIGMFQFIPFILINRQPNLSTSLVIIGILVVQLFVSKLHYRTIRVHLSRIKKT